jgi:peptidoglycan/xylan/chitin deacetylase (PgdA/CDA1 family)
MTWGSKTIQSNFYLKSICSGDRNEKSVAITFDDGPDAQVTPMILDILKENNVRAAFFIVGNKAEKNPEILKRIDKEGHVIGGHSYSHHFFFDLFSSHSVRHEMRKTDSIVFAATGKRMSLFRPPYGVTNPPIAKAIKALEYQSIGWSLKSNDTVIEDASIIQDRLIAKLKCGDIILFHDNKPWTVKVLGNFIPYLHKKEFSVIRLDKFLNIRAYDN